jgi:capsular polysaccharide biosynthesis protein
MRPPLPPSTDAFPTRCYRAALHLYPEAHRARFGLEMEQVFHQQWRQVRAQHSVVAVLAFGILITSDLLLTSCHERLRSLLSWFPMKHPLSPSSRLLWSLGAGVPVALIILAATVAVTLAIPSTFQSTTRIMVPVNQQTEAEHQFQIQAETAAILSDVNLSRVAEALSLSQRYADERHRRGPLLQPSEIVSILRDRVSVEQYRKTGILGIRVREYDRDLAADIANALATNYEVIDAAMPGLKPVRPNIYLNTFFGGVIGTGLGLVTALIVWLLLRGAAKRENGSSSHGRAMPA